jgi:DNA modification methylase
MNRLYYGDNLPVLRGHVADESVDLVYLDPPFNSKQDYNAFFEEKSGTKAAAQIKAFGDTWTWDEEAARIFEETVEAQAGGRVSDALRAFRAFLGTSDMMAYLAMMAPRLVELRRVMKPTASLYLHCDPTASHYLKMLMDAIFGPENYRNEIIWKRTSGHSDSTRFGNVHDTIMFFVKSDKAVWNDTFQPYEEAYVEQYYRYSDPDGRKFMSGDLGAAGLSGGGYDYEWKGVRRIWRCPETTMAALDAAGKVFYTKNGIPRMKRYLDEAKGMPTQDVWTDIEALRSWHRERLGYPTQKPIALLERIVSASSNPGDTVLDPFCGCGTTIDAAQKLGRQWIGIDITHLAIGLIKKRLRDAYGPEVEKTYKVIGEPTTVEDAATLAKDDPYQFQWWALGLVGARPAEEKKGADKGIDGRLFFHDEKGGKTKQIVLSVKAGALHATYVRDLRGVLEREAAEIAVLLCFDEPTQLMRTEGASSGFYTSPAWGTKHPRLQILTIKALMDGKGIDYPAPVHTNVTLKKAPVVYPESENLELLAAEDKAPYGKKPKR